MSTGKLIIYIEAVDTGKKDENGQVIHDLDYEVVGNKRNLTLMLYEGMVKDANFRQIAKDALRMSEKSKVQLVHSQKKNTALREQINEMWKAFGKFCRELIKMS